MGIIVSGTKNHTFDWRRVCIILNSFFIVVLRKKDGHNVLAVRPGMPDGITTFFHEMGHMVLGHIARVKLHDDREDLQELQAESAALICLHALGMSSFEESSVYIQE